MDSAVSTPAAPSKGTGTTIVLTLLGFLLFGLLIIWLQRLAPAPDPNAARAAERRAFLEETRKMENAAMTEILWVDKEAGLVSVPPSTIQDQVIAELAAKPVAPSAVSVDPLAAAPSAAAPAGDAAAPANPDAAPASNPETPR